MLSRKIADEEESDRLGYSLSSLGGRHAANGGCSWVFTQRIDEWLEENNNGAYLKALATNIATHELGHHRAYLTEACTDEWDEENRKFKVDSSHFNEDGAPDGDCVMCTKEAPYGTMTVYSVCGSDKSQLSDLYYCSECQNTIKWIGW